MCQGYNSQRLTLWFSSSHPGPSPSAITTSSSGRPSNFSSIGSPSHKLLLNTSTAATSCIPGDRWIFVQDVTGAIGAAQFSSSASAWNSTLQQSNFTPAKVGTALSASCIILTDEQDLTVPGPYVRSLCSTFRSNFQ